MKTAVRALGRRIDLNLVIVFEAIFRCRNLTAAGREIGMSQSAMSHALSRLRTDFADPLFVRFPGGLKPTPVAEEIAPAFVEGLACIREGFERRVFDPATSTRLFTIGMGGLGEATVLPRVVKQAHAQAPQVAFATREVAAAQLGNALADGILDVALGIDERLGAGCREMAIAENVYACVARSGHPRVGRQLTLRQFRECRHLLVKQGASSHHGTVIERALRQKAVAATIAVEVASFQSVGPLVAQSDLLATVPIGLANLLARRWGLRVLPPPVALPAYTLSLYWHERYHRDPGNIWLRALFSKLTPPRP
ncbi:MAG TPA: LysR family transcriptional regulator [Usitatibacter sp.]|nr:LysR family transcriptional regulator [Usitatibacter sp.]